MVARGEAEGARCRKCRRSSLLARHFRRRRCPACQPYEYGLAESLGLILYGCIGGGVLVWLTTSGLVVLASYFVLGFLVLVLHETAHALVAALVGWRVHYVGIGSGRPWKRIRLGKLLVLLCRRQWTGTGFCGTGPRDAYSRGAITAILAAPLVLHAVAAAVAFPWASRTAVVPSLFVVLNLFALAWNAWPRDVGQEQVRSTDGKLLLELWRAPEAARKRWNVARWVNPISVDMIEGQLEDAFAAAERALEAYPADEQILAAFAAAAVLTGRYGSALPCAAAVAALETRSRPRHLSVLRDGDLAARGLFRGEELEDYVRGGMLVGTGRLDEVLDLSERRLAAATSEEARALWQGCVALALLLDQRDLARAEEAARWAYERLPWVPFVETAWGMARIERGDFAEGLAAFARAKKADAEGRMASLQAAWTAVAHAGSGKRELAHDLADTLRAPSVWPACRRRVERALAP